MVTSIITTFNTGLPFCVFGIICTKCNLCLLECWKIKCLLKLVLFRHFSNFSLEIWPLNFFRVWQPWFDIYTSCDFFIIFLFSAERCNLLRQLWGRLRFIAISIELFTFRAKKTSNESNTSSNWKWKSLLLQVSLVIRVDSVHNFGLRILNSI